MSLLAPEDVIAYLADNQLVSPSQLEAVDRDGLAAGSPEQILETLVQRGALTHFQHATIRAGDVAKLVLGPYRIESPLGEGGMGVVYLARQPKLDRPVALKVIRPQILAVKPDVVHRFQREARAIARMVHPNIVVLYDADEINGTHFIAMEYIDGMSLERMTRLNGPMPIKQACDYIRQTALGLQHAHENGMVHRDVKPSNILVARKSSSGGSRITPASGGVRRPALVTPRDRDLASDSSSCTRAGSWGTVKILDMGLARLADSLEDEKGQTPLTRAGVLLGTPDFIAPEQARDARQADCRSDIYSLGCTFYYILTGRPPFPGGTDVQKLLRHQSERPAPLEELRPHIPHAISAIVERMMGKRREARYQTPQALADELLAFLEGSTTPLPGTLAVMNMPGLEKLQGEEVAKPVFAKPAAAKPTPPVRSEADTPPETTQANPAVRDAT